MWVNPVPYKLVVTEDSNSFYQFKEDETGLPINNHVGAFGIKRTHDTHTGVDLYVKEGAEIVAVEKGIVIDVFQFTGTAVNSAWWNDTQAVTIKGPSGIVLYGEISPSVIVGQVVAPGELIGKAIPVLKKDKGRPMCMLHMELYSEKGKLLDPTQHLREIAEM